MKKLGVLLELIKVHDKLLPTLKCLGPDRVTVYIRTADLLVAPTDYWPILYQPILDEIKRMGLEFVAIDSDDLAYEKALDHDVYYVEADLLREGRKAPCSNNAIDVRFFKKNQLALALKRRGKHFICDTYSLELTPTEGNLFPGVFFLSASEEIMFRGLGRGELLCDADGTPIMGTSPTGGELASVGLPNATEKRLALGRANKRIYGKNWPKKWGYAFSRIFPWFFT